MPGSFVATGITIAFGTSAFQAQILGVSITGMERESIDTSHMGTTDWKTFMPAKLTDPGSLELKIAFDPDDQPPITGAAETITVTWPIQDAPGTSANWSAQGFVTEFEVTAELEEKMEADVTVKLSGSVTFTDEV